MTRRVLDLVRRTPAPGHDADALTHEWVAQVEHDGGPAALEVHGIATVWDVLVDDVVVASGRSMWQPARVELALAPGRHVVLVRVHPLTDVLDAAPRRPRARWRTMLVEEPRLRWVRTTVLGRAPGFAPGPPLVGPHRPVVLVTDEPVRVTDLRLVPRLLDPVDPGGTTDGMLEVVAHVHGLPVGAVVRVEVTGPSGTTHVDAPVRDGGRVVAGVVLHDVRRWAPHTHGTPHLHDVRLRHDGEPLPLPGDATLPDPAVRRVGFRALRNDRPGSLALCVDDVPVFVRGVVWTPGDLAALDEAVALGFNLVRVSGVSGWESDAFHARCDELGLMVWQDLPLVTFDYPLADAAFVADLVREVELHGPRVRQHASTVVVCGSAEHEQQAAMFGVRGDTGAARELAALTRPLVAAHRGKGVDVLWVDSSPTGGDPVTRVDTGVAQYFGVGAYLRPLSDARTSGVLFAAEALAFSHLPAAGPTDAGVPRDHGADWDFADVRRHYLVERHGPDATVEQEQQVTGEVMAQAYGEWRRPASPCAGAVVLWLRDLEPGAGWGLLDHTGRPKPAAAVLAPVLAPTAVWLVDEGLSGLDVHVAHDRPEPVELALRVELRRADGSVVDAADAALALPGHGHRVLGVEALLGRFADVAWAHRFGPAPHTEVVATVTGPGVDREARWRVPPP